MSRRLQRVRVAHSLPADALLGWASWHLNTAQLGWDMFQRALPEGDQNLTGHPMHTVEIAAENLIFRGVVSAMDLCAAAVFRLTGEPLRADRERDVAWWLDQKKVQPWHLVPAHLQRWLGVFHGDKTWELATELRHGFTHRSVRRHINVLVGAGRVSVQLEVAGVLYDAAVVMPRLVMFGRQRYSSFERALARTYPIR